MAELIVHGNAETADITPFDFSRFESGEQLKGKAAYDRIWR